MNKRRSDLAIMGSLIGLVKPLTFIMLTGILLGVLGFLCAIFITILGGYGVIKGLAAAWGSEVQGQFTTLLSASWHQLFSAILVFGFSSHFQAPRRIVPPLSITSFCSSIRLITG